MTIPQIPPKTLTILKIEIILIITIFFNLSYQLSMANIKIDKLSIKDIELIIEKLDKKKDYITSFLYTFYMCETTGSSASINNLGYHYDMGFGVIVNKKNAINLYKLAIDKGSAKAIVNLAVCYYHGDGGNKRF